MGKLFYICLAAVITLQACSQTSENTEPQPANPVNWITPAVAASNTTFKTFLSRSANTTVSYHIFLPDERAQEPDRKFTVLYWLHGTGGGNTGIPVLADYFLKAMREKKIEPMIIVFPNGLPYGMWCNSKDGRFFILPQPPLSRLSRIKKHIVSIP